MDVCSVHISLIVSQVALNAPIDLLSCFFTLSKLFFDEKLQSVYIVSLPIVHYLCHWASSNHHRRHEKQKFHVLASAISFLLCSLALSVSRFLQENLIQEEAKNRLWLSDFFPPGMWNYFLLLLCFILFLILVRSVSSLPLLHHLLFIGVVPIVAQQSQWIYSWDVLCALFSCSGCYSTASENQKLLHRMCVWVFVWHFQVTQICILYIVKADTL